MKSNDPVHSSAASTVTKTWRNLQPCWGWSTMICWVCLLRFASVHFCGLVCFWKRWVFAWQIKVGRAWEKCWLKSVCRVFLFACVGVLGPLHGLFLPPGKSTKFSIKNVCSAKTNMISVCFFSSVFSGSNFWITEMGKSRSFAGRGGDLNPGCFMFQNSWGNHAVNQNHLIQLLISKHISQYTTEYVA